MDREFGIERDETASLSSREGDEISIVHLLMTESLEIDRGVFRVGRRPKTMLFVGQQFAEQRGCLLRRHGRWSIGGVGGKTHESELRERASRPSVFGFCAKPTMCRGVVLMIWPGER